MDYEYELIQGGIVVASVTAPCEEDALREIMHYAMVYAQDGPCMVRPTPTPSAENGESG